MAPIIRLRILNITSGEPARRVERSPPSLLRAMVDEGGTGEDRVLRKCPVDIFREGPACGKGLCSTP